MEPQFVRIDTNTVVNLSQVVAVDFKPRRTDDSAARQYIDVYTTHGTYKCHFPYIDGLSRAIADRTV